MDLDLGRDEMIVVGASIGMLHWFAEELPPGSVVLVEEPEIIARRDVAGTVTRLPVVSRVVAARYQTGLDVEELLAREPGLAVARLVMPGLEYAVGAAARLAERLGLPGAGPEAPMRAAHARRGSVPGYAGSDNRAALPARGGSGRAAGLSGQSVDERHGQPESQAAAELRRLRPEPSAIAGQRVRPKETQPGASR